MAGCRTHKVQQEPAPFQETLLQLERCKMETHLPHPHLQVQQSLIFCLSPREGASQKLSWLWNMFPFFYFLFFFLFCFLGFFLSPGFISFLCGQFQFL